MKDDTVPPRGQSLITHNGDAKGDTITIGTTDSHSTTEGSNRTISKADCACGGCATGTTCVHDRSAIKAGLYPGTYVYAAPDVLPFETIPPHYYLSTDATTPFTSDQMRQTLQDEIIQDLLERVRRTEKDLEKLREEHLDTQAALDAIRDILEDETANTFSSILRKIIRDASR